MGRGGNARFRFFLMGHACVQLLTLLPLSRCLYRKFVEAQSEHALGDKFFEPGDRERIHAASALHDYKKDTFDFMQNTALSAMRKGQFPRFCEHQFFDRLMAVKQGQPSAIMLEREMGPSTLKIILDCQPLAQIINGDTKCGSASGERVLSRTVELVEDLYR